MIVKEGRTPQIMPFEMTGVVRDDAGILRYTGLPSSLLEMFRATVDRLPDAEALYELGGERVSYRDFWDRSARVAGGLRAAGVGRGDRVANRLGNGNNWAFAFWGIQMIGAVAVPVNTRFTAAEVEYVSPTRVRRTCSSPMPRCPTASRYVVDDLEPDRARGDLLHERHHRVPQGRDDHPRELPVELRDLPCASSHLAGDADLRNLISVPLFHVTGCNSQLLITHDRSAERRSSCRRSMCRRSCARSSTSASTCSRRCPRSTGWP